MRKDEVEDVEYDRDSGWRSGSKGDGDGDE